MGMSLTIDLHCILMGVLLGLFRGLSSEYLPEDRRVNPNEGTWRSLRISVSVGISSGVVSGFIGFLSTMLYFGLYTVLEQGWNIGLGMGLHAGFSNVLGIGLHTGLVVGLQVGVFGALLAGAPMGGLAFLRHCLLRWLLWRSHKIPFNYSRFVVDAERKQTYWMEATFKPGTVYTETTGDHSVVEQLDPDTGIVTIVATGFLKPTSLVFVPNQEM